MQKLLRAASGLVALVAAEAAVSARPAALTAPPPTDYSASSLQFEAAADRSGLPAGVGTRAICEAMVAEAVSWAAINGLLMRAPADDGAAPVFAHAPFSLLPAEFPADELARARRLAPLFGHLVDRVGRDVPWLSQTLRGAGDSDDFTRRLLKICAQVQREGATQHARLALLRSDYMLHEPPADAEGKRPARLLQVELNTIASSFGALASSVGRLHTTLAQRWAGYRQAVWQAAGKPSKLALSSVLPPSDAIDGLCAGIARAHAEYGVPEAAVCFVVQPDEGNTIDQDTLAERLWSAHGVRVIRRTLAQLAHEGKLRGKERRLTLSGGLEVSVAYYRCGYTPSDYPSSRQWEARTLVERSHAIKCPCIEHHLVGCKKVQQQLAVPGELERFMSAEEAAEMRGVFAGLWALSGSMEPAEGAPAEEREAAAQMRAAIASPDEFVMKPQREGGGHNLFGAELSSALSSLSREQRSAFILMQRIRPRMQPSVLVRGGETSVGPAASELGVYSTLLSSSSGRVLLNEPAGHLVRTKFEGVDEGGVAAGFAVLSSPLAAR